MRLSEAEEELLADPWYHDFEPLGLKTPQRAGHYVPNQLCKQGALFRLIDEAVKLCRERGCSARGVELFCADGFYANYAVKCGAERVHGIDLDEREIAKARLITKLLGNSDRVTFEVCDVSNLSGRYDFGVCAGGLYHISDPEALLRDLAVKVDGPLVVQTVVSLANSSPEYFEAPAPGWTWGCRFSYEYLLKMVEDGGWRVVQASTSELKGNDRPEDRGSAYLLCIPTRWRCQSSSVELFSDPNKHAGEPGLELGSVVRFTGYQNFSLSRNRAEPYPGDTKLLSKHSLVRGFFDPEWLQGRSVLDLGANSAFFCFLGLLNGAEKATAVDVDDDYIDMVTRAKRHLEFADLEVVKANVTDYDQPSDVVLAFALIHWIYSCTAAYGSLGKAVEKLASLTNQVLIIEWVEPGDEAIKFFGHLDWNRDSVTGEYSREEFETALKRHFPEVELLGRISATRHVYAAYRDPAYKPSSLSAEERFLSLLHHVIYREGAVGEARRQRLLSLLAGSQTSYDPDRICDFSYGCRFLEEHGRAGAAPKGPPTPMLPYLHPPQQVLYSRVIVVHEGTEYHSRIYLVEEDGAAFVRKQALFDLAEREYHFLSKLGGAFFPKARRAWKEDCYSVCDMDFVHGYPLTDVERFVGEHNSEQTSQFMHRCLDILDILHREGITHRDIRSDNILVRADQPVLLDFSWAVSEEMPCMTPEGLGREGRPPDQSFCDVYSMGIALAPMCFYYPEFAHVIQAMTEPSAAVRTTDIPVLRRMLDQEQPTAERFKRACTALASAYAQQRQFDDADEVVGKLLARSPKQPDVLNLLGEAALASGDSARARAYFAEALRQDGAFLSARCNLACAFEAGGMIEEAARLYGEVLDRDPTDEKALQTAPGPLGIGGSPADLGSQAGRATANLATRAKPLHEILAALSRRAGTPPAGLWHGTCSICGSEVDFIITNPDNLRESLACPSCQSISRDRLLIHVFGLLLGEAAPLARWTVDRELRVFETSGQRAHPRFLCGRFDYYNTEFEPDKMQEPYDNRRYADLQKTPYEDGFFDAILSSDVLEHVRLYEQALHEVYRVLKPGGVVLLQMPYVHEREQTQVMVQPDGDRDIFLAEPQYHASNTLVYRVYGRELLKELEEAGFEVEHVRAELPGFGIPVQDMIVCRKPALQHGSVLAAARCHYASLLCAAGKLDEAVQQLEEVLAIDPGDAQAHNDLGVLHFQKGELQEALMHLESALHLDSGDADIAKNLAEVYLSIGRAADAVQLYERILAGNPDDVEALEAVGHLCRQAGYTEQAAAFFRRLLDLEPDRADVKEAIGALEEQAAPAEGPAEAGASPRETAQEAKEGLQCFEDRMKEDWDKRAREDARYYVYSARRGQTEDEFDSSGKLSVEELVVKDLATVAGGRDPKSMTMLEIGCGLGRMTRYLAGVFGEVHGVDVSGEMIRRARERLRSAANVRLYENNGRDLSMFPDAMFDFAFSFIVFQHIPSKDVVLSYIREAHRVLKPGGVFKFQVQGSTSASYLKAPKDTWHGVTITEEDVDGLCAEPGFELLAKSGQGMQYSWYTLRKVGVGAACPQHSASAAPEMPLVSIIIPVYNGLKLTQGCLRSISNNTGYPNCEIIVVDNGSVDGTTEYLRQVQSDRLRPVFHKENLGFVEACNSGAAAASGGYLLFLNNDTEVQPGWLESLVEFTQATPDCGAVGAKLVYPNGRLQEAGGIIFSDGSGCNYGKGQNPNDPRFNFVREVDYCSGAALLVRKTLWDEIGGFDRRYAPAYYEDTDLCFEIRRRGFKVYYQPKSVVVHYEGQTAGTSLQSGYKRYQVENRRKFVEKWAADLAGQSTNDRRNVARASNRQTRGSVLVVDPFMPWFDRASGSLRLFSILKILRQLGFHVTFIARNPSMEERYRPILEDMGIEVYAGDPAAMRAAGARLDSVPRVPYDVLFRERQFDYAIISFWHVAEYYMPLVRRLSPETQVIVDTVDVHFLREMREAELKHDPELEEKALTNKRWELAVYRQADRLWVVTEQDKDAVRELIPHVAIDVVPNIHAQIDATKAYENTSDLMFVGNFNHPPNRDAVQYLCDEILPLVRRELPGVKLYIVGANPPSEVRALASDHVVVTGFVEDLSPYLEQARISVSPLRYGAGMKGKVGEALAWGLPAVTTSIGAEGMDLVNGREALIADTAEDFAAQIVRLYRDPELWRRLSENGRAKVRQWSPEAVKERLVSLLDTLPEPRKKLVSIVVLACNQLSYTRKCLESIEQHTATPYELIVVDNGSTDGTEHYLSDLQRQWEDSKAESRPCKAVEVVRHDQNLGYAAGNNAGIAVSEGDYVLLLNNDVVATPGWLERLVAHAERNPRVGIVGPMTNLISGPQRVDAVSYQTSNLNGLNEFAARWAEEHAGEAVVCRRVVGFCALLSRSLIDEIGGLDTRFGIGNFEDDDLCIRAVLAGFRCVIAKDCFVHHFGSRTFAGEGIDRDRLILANWEILKEKWGLPRDLAYGRSCSFPPVLARKFEPELHRCPIAADGVRQEQWFAAPRWEEAAAWRPLIEEFARLHRPGDGSVLRLYAGPLTDSTSDDAYERVNRLVEALGLPEEDVPDIEITDELPGGRVTRIILTGGELDHNLRRRFGELCVGRQVLHATA